MTNVQWQLTTRVSGIVRWDWSLVIGHSGFGSQSNHSSAPAAPFRRRVAERLHERVTGQDRTNDRPLGARAAAVNDTHLTQSTPGALRQVLPDELGDVPWREGVKVQGVLDGKNDRGLGLDGVRANIRLVGIFSAGGHGNWSDQASGGGLRSRKGLTVS
jgi:hypothetical protein